MRLLILARNETRTRATFYMSIIMPSIFVIQLIYRTHMNLNMQNIPKYTRESRYNNLVREDFYNGPS